MPKQANPFRPGDTAYHPGFGKVKVLSIERGVDIQVQDYGKEYMIPQWTIASLLSFTPWPEPVHVRPLEDGYYLVRSDSMQYTNLAIYSTETKSFNHVNEDGKASRAYRAVVYPVAYLGTKMEWWQS